MSIQPRRFMSIAQSMPQNIVILPNVVPPVPPFPPGPPINPINSTINDTTGVIYNKIANKIVNIDTANLLNGIYVSKNTNSIPLNFTAQNILNINRYVSGTSQNLAINDNALAITTNLNIYFWLYIVYNGNLTRPVTILTKGTNSSFGEFTVQILPSRVLSFFYTNNGIMYTLRSQAAVPEHTLIYVSIIKTAESVGIYFNNRAENIQRMLGVATATNNPLLIGDGYNSSPFNGFIDNLIISNNSNGASFINTYFSYVPTSIFYQFTNGSITYNGFNVLSNINGIQPINLDSAKFICTQLENFTNGFSLSNNNQYLYYINYNVGVTNNGGVIYEKINTLNMANNTFTKLILEFHISKNVSFDETILIDGYIKAYTGEVFYFIDGVLYEFDIQRGIFSVVNLTEIQAYNLLSIIIPIIGYRFSFGRYQYFSNVINMKENNPGLNNIFVRKLSNYLIGGISTIVNLSGQSNAGSFRFYSDIQYLNLDTNRFRSIEEVTDKNELLINKTVIMNSITHENNNNEIFLNKRLGISSDNNTENVNMVRGITDNFIENNIYVYIGQNILGLINNPSDVFVNNLPTLDITIPFYFGFDKEVDIIETLLPINIPLNRLIVVNSSIAVVPRLYNFSIISNTQTKLIINNKEFKINCNTPQHIVFHCSKNVIDIEIEFYYNKLNQICKYVLI